MGRREISGFIVITIVGVICGHCYCHNNSKTRDKFLPVEKEELEKSKHTEHGSIAHILSMIRSKNKYKVTWIAKTT